MAEPATAPPSTPRGTRSPGDPTPPPAPAPDGELSRSPLPACCSSPTRLCVRPWQDDSTVAGAIKAMRSGAWVVAHLFAVVGFILVALGLPAVWTAVRRTRAEFSTPSALRIAHGVRVAAGSMWVALALWRASQAQAGS